jgi:hypothetical protein
MVENANISQLEAGFLGHIADFHAAAQHEHGHDKAEHFHHLHQS